MKCRWIILLVFVLLFSGCGTQIDRPALVSQPVVTYAPPVMEPYPVSFDGENFDSAPETVASLSPALTEILWDFAPDKIIGVSDYCDYPEIGGDIKRLGSPANPDIEAITALAPQLLVTSAPLAEADISKLKQAGIRVLKFAPPVTFAQLCEIYVKIAMIFDGAVDFRVSAAEALYDIDESMKEADKLEKHTFVVVEGKSEEGLYLSPGFSLSSDMLSVFGDNLRLSAEDYSADEDELYELAPEVVFYATGVDREKVKAEFPRSKLIEIDFERFERPTRRIKEVIDKCAEELS